jgi:hypothetical protein
MLILPNRKVGEDGLSRKSRKSKPFLFLSDSSTMINWLDLDKTELRVRLRGAVVGCLRSAALWAPWGSPPPADERRRDRDTEPLALPSMPLPLIFPVAVALGTPRLRAAVGPWLCDHDFDYFDFNMQGWWMTRPRCPPSPAVRATAILLRAVPGAVHDLAVPAAWEREDLFDVVRVALQTQSGVLQALCVPGWAVHDAATLTIDILTALGHKGLRRLRVPNFTAMFARLDRNPPPQLVDALARCTALESIEWSLPFSEWARAIAPGGLGTMLRELTLYEDVDVHAIAAALPNLRSLKVVASRGIDEFDRAAWKAALPLLLPRLQCLYLELEFDLEELLTAVADAFRGDAAGATLPLCRFGFELCRRIRGAEVRRQLARLAAHAPLLEMLTMGNATPVALAGAVHFTSCRVLEIRDRRRSIDDAAVAAVVAGMPQLRCLDITGCSGVKFEATAYEGMGVYGRHKLRLLLGIRATASPDTDDLALAIFRFLRRLTRI